MVYFAYFSHKASQSFVSLFKKGPEMMRLLLVLMGGVMLQGAYQNYYNLNPQQAYCQYVIVPKLEKFKEVFKERLKK